VESPDAGRVAIYTTADPAEFICIAQNPEAVGLDRQVMALSARFAQSRFMREELGELKRKARQVKADTWRRVLDSEAASAAAQLETIERDASSNVSGLPYKTDSLKAAAAAEKAIAAIENAAAPVLYDEHPDRAEIDAEYERIEAERLARVPYDEAADIAAAVARYREILAIPPEKRTPKEADDFDLLEPLPEIQAFKRSLRAA
jgi:hypothetical protein